ncbi:hypothetical protein K438DRAFT_2007747 [Mycena galopus ATCC 62051]|nr:hypothetical protein K438DRAFT_2007747 [Mycena galopus ATCC 62051]
MAQTYLPQEIVHLVVGQFPLDNRTEKYTIAQCGLVCKTWLPASRYRFFADVDLNDRTIISFLYAVGKSVSTVIRSLGLSFSGQEGTVGLDETLRRLGPLPLVTTLRLVMKDEVLLQDLALLAHTFPNTTTLVFRNVSLPLSSVFCALSAFQLLKSLELDWVRVSYDTLQPSYEFPPRWNSLTLALLMDDDKPKDPQQLFRQLLFKALFSLDPVPVLSSLSMRGMDLRKGSHLERYLSRMGNPLHHLRLESGPSPFFGSHDLSGLKLCKSLRQLELVFQYHTHIAGTVLDVIFYDLSPNLTRLSVFDKIRDGLTTKFVASRWDILDKELAAEQFAKLQTFRVETSSQTLINGLSTSMPLSRGRGILRVVDAR